MSKKFQVITADCPWDFGDSLRMSDVPRGARANYGTMTIPQIKGLPVKDLADPDGCLLALWIPSSMLVEGLEVLSAWGFKHKQTYVWVKTKKDPWKVLKRSLKDKFFQWKNLHDYAKDEYPLKSMFRLVFGITSKETNLSDILSFGMGRLFRQTHEICLVGINNNKIYKKLANKSQRSVSFGENLRHSAKPEHLQDSLEKMFPGTDKIELFARRIRPGWVCLGNEVCNGEDIAVSIAKL